MVKIFIIRFSSIGDIIQCMSVTHGIKEAMPDAELHWVTRKDLAPILRTDKDIDKIWEFDRKLGFKGLVQLAKTIRNETPDVIYDAHLNIRSAVMRSIISPRWKRILGIGTKCIVRKKNRFGRFLFFNLGVKNAIEFPFRGMVSFQRPLIKHNLYKESEKLKNWYFPDKVKNKVNALFQEEGLEKGDFITIIPSAAWELKRWPVEHWKELVKRMPDKRFVILAGPEDTFTKEIAMVDPKRIVNFYGRTNLLESFYIVFLSNMVVSADTGFLHAADLFKRKAISLMGPTAYGHPTGKTVKILELDLPCRPCTKEGNAECKIKETKKCLVDITPTIVQNEVDKIMAN